MTTKAGRRMWCAVILCIAIGGAVSGCGGTSDRPAGAAGSTAATDAAHAQSMNQQEIERLRKERDRLRAEVSARATQATTSASPGATAGPPAAAGDPSDLRASFDTLAARLGGAEGLAFTSVGGGATTQLGSWRTGPGWSTVKVPVAVAVVAKAQGRPDASAQRLMRRALTASDNAAAEQLWASLGEPRTAAATVQSVLRSGGDGSTIVQSQRVRPGFTAFGQTSWSLANQSAFVARLPCISYSGDVLALMGEVEPGQRWGIGAVGLPAQFKGGWGPGLAGGYLVRQMGVVTLANGSRIGLSIASVPVDGRFETGAANLTALARWAVANVKPARSGGC